MPPNFHPCRLTDWPASLAAHTVSSATILAVLVLSGCGDPHAPPETVEPVARPVRVVEARVEAPPRLLRLPGALRATQRARPGD